MSNKITLNNFSFSVSCEDFFTEKKNGGFKEKSPFFVLSFNAFPEVDLGDEIDGSSELLAELAQISIENMSTVFCGVTTQILGLKHISVAVCHKGKLVDIVDRTANPLNDKYETSEKIKVFSTDAGSIGVLIDTDILIEKNWQKISEASDIILCIAKGSDERFVDAAQSLSHKYALPFLLVNDTSVEWRE